jgi:hypothetical protein
MSKCIVVCLLFLVSTQAVFAQNFSGEIQSSPIIKEKVKNRASGYKIVGVIADKGYFLYLPYEAVYKEKCVGCNRNYYIASYDSEMTLLKKSIVDLTWNNNEMEFEELQVIGERLILFSSYQNTKTNKHYLFVREIDPSSLDSQGDPKMIAELDYSGYGKYRKTSLVTRVSEDQSKIMVFYSFLSKDDLIIKSGLKVFDRNFKEIWQLQDFKPDKSTGELLINLFKIDNQGNVYIGGIIYGEKTYRDWSFTMEFGLTRQGWFFFERPNYKYHLYALTQNGEQTLYKELSLSQKFIRALDFKPESPQKLICYGLWSDEGMVSPNGSFLFQLNIKEGLVENPAFNEFSTKSEPKILSEGELTRFQKSIDNRKEWDPFSYRLSDLMVKPDGESFFIAEQWLDGRIQEGSGKYIVIKQAYFYGDLFVTFTGTPASGIRTIRIPKTQYMLTTDQSLGYFVTQKENHIVLVYGILPRKKNYTRKMPIGDQVMTDIEPAGQVSTTTLHKNIPTNGHFMVPASTLRVSENVIGYARTNLATVTSYFFEKLTIVKE